MSQTEHRPPSTHLIAIPPPPPPPDLMQSARFLPLSAVTASLRGTKIRLIGQILAFDPLSSLLLITSNPSAPTARQTTLIINLSIPLLGQSPGAKDISDIQGNLFSRTPQPMGSEEARKQSKVKREKLKMDKGQWVCVIGWLEGEMPKGISNIDPGGSYLPPIPVVLEAIHISPSGPPPLNAIYRGQIP